MEIKNLKIPECNFESFEKRIKKLNRIATKLNLTPIEYKITNEVIEKITVKGLNSEFKTIVKFYIIEINGELPQIPNWEFVGIIEHNPKLNIIKKLSDIEIDNKYYTSSCSCDHCKTNRERKITIIVKNTKTNEFKQVGKSCLKDYCGHSALEHFQLNNDINCLDEFEEVEKNHKSNYFDVKEILLMTYYHLKTNDFISGKMAMETEKQSTANYIICNYYEFNYNKISEDDREQVNIIIDYIKNSKLSVNDYVNNLIALVNNEYFHLKNIGYVVSMISFYKREIAKQAAEEVKKNNNVSEYIGSIKDKIEMEITYITSFWYETQWGSSYLHKFLDSNGNILIWSTNKGLELTEGNKYTIKGTVKEHSEYRQEKQTYITRCKIAS